MNFSNQTPYETLWTTGYGKDGRERITVVVKATYRLSDQESEKKSGQPATLELAEKQASLIEADEFQDGDPINSPPQRETDFAQFKPRCDVLFNGCAYARSQRSVAVALRVGTWSKGFNVLGPRVWKQRKLVIEPSRPEPFERLCISYANAYGGTEADQDHPEQIKSYPTNPAGVGYHPYLKAPDGWPMPNTEQPQQPVLSPRGNYRPMALGPIGRSWLPRRNYVGTYDEVWTDKRAPYLPDDFDPQYFQAGPPDQQIPYPRGGEVVTLGNLTPSRRMSFVLPSLEVPVLFIPYKKDAEQQNAVVDTILIEPEEQVLCLTARTVFELRRNMFELRETIVGGQQRDWLKQQRFLQSGKRHYPNLDALIRARRMGGDDE